MNIYMKTTNQKTIDEIQLIAKVLFILLLSALSGYGLGTIVNLTIW